MNELNITYLNLSQNKYVNEKLCYDDLLFLLNLNQVKNK